MFTAGMRSTESNEWETPRWLFDELDAEFHFELDCASTDANALCERHYTAEQDGLASPWGSSNWCNPPYGREIGKWCEKAALGTPPGGVSVLLVPSRTDTRWWHSWVVPYATEVRFVRGRLRFSGSGASAPFPSAIVVYDRRESGYWKVRP